MTVFACFESQSGEIMLSWKPSTKGGFVSSRFEPASAIFCFSRVKSWLDCGFYLNSTLSFTSMRMEDLGPSSRLTFDENLFVRSSRELPISLS